MKPLTEYYHFKPTAGAAVEGRAYADGEQTEALECGRCPNFLAPPATPINFFATSGFNRADFEPTNVASLDLVHVSFISLIDSALLDQCLVLGDVFDTKGRQLPDWRTLRPKSYTMLRGSINAGYRYCVLCGRLNSFAQGKRYVSPGSVELPIVGTGLGLLMRAEIGQPLRERRWRKIEILPVPVISPPLDGFPPVMPWQVPVIDGVPQFFPASDDQPFTPKAERLKRVRYDHPGNDQG